MDAVPVPVHFDGHNINIITDDSPAMCKDRTKNLAMFRPNKNKKRGNKALRNGHLTEAPKADNAMVSAADSKAPQSATNSLSPVDSNGDASNEANDSVSPGLSGGVSYKSKTMRDPPATAIVANEGTAMTAESAAVSTNDLEAPSMSRTPSSSSPSKKRGINPNAKPFVMSSRCPLAGNIMSATSPNHTRQHREDYQLPPRIRNRENVSGFTPHSAAPRRQYGGYAAAPRISDDQLIAQGFNPEEFGSHDDQIMDDEDHQKKGKDRRSLFKTELCREYSTSGWCYYNKRCSFAHGLHELRPVFRSKKWRTKRCRNWHTTGYCPYEHRCQFLHDQSPPRRMTDYAQTNARALVAAQQRMKPLYFHYQVDIDRDTADDPEAAAANTDGKKSQRDPTPGSSRSGSGINRSATRLEPAENGKVFEAGNDGGDSTKKKKKNPVITQFNPAADVYQPNPYQFGRAPPAAAQGVAAPFGIYQGAIPSVVPLPMNGVSVNQSLINAINVPLPSPAMTANTFGPTATVNPRANVDAAIYLNFSPTPDPVMYSQEVNTAAAAKNGVASNNMMPSLALTDAQNAAGGALQFPDSLTGASDANAVSKTVQNLETEYEQQVASMFDKVYNEMNRQNLAAHQQQQVLNAINMPTLGPAFGANASPTPNASESSCFFDDAALMDLLPQDVHHTEADNGQQANGDTPRFADHESDPVGNVAGNGPLSVSRHSTQTAANTEKTARTLSRSRRDGVNDDSKTPEEDNILTMAGIELPCPPALQLQSSVDSVVMGAVNAAMIANQSPAAIHVQAQQIALAQRAHAFAQAHAYAQNPHAFAAAMSPDYADALTANVTAAPAAPPGPYAYNMPSAVLGGQIQALRIQPPATLKSTKLPSNPVDDQWMTGFSN